MPPSGRSRTWRLGGCRIQGSARGPPEHSYGSPPRRWTVRNRSTDPKQPSVAHEAIGLSRGRRVPEDLAGDGTSSPRIREQLQPRSDPEPCPPLHPTISSLAGNNLEKQPGAGVPSDAPKGKAQGITKKFAAFTGVGGRQISRGYANAMAAKGDAGEDYGAGGVIRIGGNPHPGTAGLRLVAQPVGEGGDLGGGVEALEHFVGGLRRERSSAAAD